MPMSSFWSNFCLTKMKVIKVVEEEDMEDSRVIDSVWDKVNIGSGRPTCLLIYCWLCLTCGKEPEVFPYDLD